MYIVNPWWFYLITFLTQISSSCGVILIFSIITFCITGIGMLMTSDERNRAFDFCHQYFKYAVVVTVVVGAIHTFIPTENTMYKMLVASYVTTDNLEIAKDTTKELHDFLVKDMSTAVDKLTDSAIKIKIAKGE